MLATHIPPLVDDAERLKALASYAILDTPAEDGFDDIVQLATHVCDAPVALVSFVAEGRQWFKARIGFPACETDLNSSVCAHALAEPDLLVIPDLARDPRTLDNPLVVGEPFIRFYAGAPLRTAAGAALGSLCVIDHQPRPGGLTEAQAESLRALARQVMRQLELRRAMLGRDELLVVQRDAIRGRDILRDILRETQAAVANAGGDIDVILETVLAGAMRALPTADAGVVELIDGEELEYRAVRGILAPHRGLRVPRHGSLGGWCAWNDEPLLIADALADRRTVPERIGRLGLRSAVLAPVARAGRVVGVLKLQSARVDAFTPEDLEIARMFAGAVTAGLTEASAAASSRAVNESESRYRAIFESATDIAIVATDRDGRITNWNVGATRILGWSSDEIRGDFLGTFFTPEDNAAGRVALEMKNALAHGRASDERWHMRKDGSRFFASGEVMPLRGAAGDHLGFIKILRDRTAEHEAGTALRDAEALLRRAQEVGGVGVFSVDLADNMLHATPEFCRLYGVPERESFPANLIEGLVHPDDVALRSDAAARERGDIVGDVTYRIHRADDGRERWIERKADIERDDAGRLLSFVGTARDITDRIVAQRDLAAEREQLAQMFEQAPTFMALLRGPDHRIERVNPGYLQLIGQREVLGKTVAEALPDAVEQGFLAILDEVYRTGEPFIATTKKYVVQPKPGSPKDERYIDLVYQPIRDADGKVYGIFTEGVDVTARTLANAELRAAERRRTVLLDLADAIRDLKDPAAIAYVSSEMLGNALAVSRVGYGTVDTANETIGIESEWDEPGVRPLDSTLQFRDYGSYIEDLKRGATVAISDVDADPRTREGAAALKAIDANAFVNMPLVEGGEFVAMLFVTSTQPRAWSENDLRFIREVGERVRVATERLKSEQALRESEEHFRVFAQAVPNHVWASRPDGYLDWFNQQVYAYGGVG